jgi:hypothetical protein
VTRSAIGLLVLVVTVVGAAACATGRAQIPEPEPVLAVPPVPPRAIDPPPVVEPAVEPPAAEPPPAPAPTVKPRPRASSDPKPDPKQDPPIEPVGPVPNQQPPAQLRTPSTPSGPDAVRQIREIIDTTQRMLDKVEKVVDPPLSDDRKANLTSARAQIQQAEEMLKKDELTQARSFAERAQNIAKLLLSGR